MQTTRRVALLCALALVPVSIPAAFGQQAPQQVNPEGTAGKPPAAAEDDAGWAVVLMPSGPGAAPGQQGSAAWSPQDIEAARERCTAQLQGLDLVAVPVDPIREGEMCGTPAPMQLISVGSSPPIVFSTPATLTCDMIVALHKWLQGDVQPLARKHLGAPVVSVNVMSSFSCRNAYGRAKTKLSEHGRVNAIDIGGFLTAQGDHAQVIADWGPNAAPRATSVKVTAGQAEAVKREAEAAASARKGKPPAAAPQPAPQIAAPASPRIYEGDAQGGTMSIAIPGLTIGHSSEQPSFGWAPPSRLGGPKEADTASPDLNGKAAFLHAAHDAACAIFSTVLGPDANRAHRNHFHLDLAERRSISICE